jgi:hypothetical protein
LHGEVPLSLCPVELSSWQPLLQAFPSPNCWVGATSPAFSAQLVYLQFAWGIAPYPLSGAWGAQPSLLHVFFFSAACLLFSLVFFLFFPGRGSVCPGGYADLSQGVPRGTYLLTWGPAK